jgi:hypothetical protein
LAELKNQIRIIEDQIQTEKTGRVQALNELTYKKIEIERLQEENLVKIKEIK